MLDGRLEAMISHDEIGIASARIGGAVVRSAFQPIYAVRGNGLSPVAVEGFARPFHEGAAMPPRAFLSKLDAGERRDAEQACLVLHARNHPHLGDPDLAHAIAVDEFALDEQGRLDRGLIAEASRTGPRGSMVRLRKTRALGPARLLDVVSAVREQGMLVSLGGLDPEATLWEDFIAARPEVVHFDGPWFRRAAASEPALRLMAQLVRRLRGDGARILVRGIETRHQLASAIAIGCDLFQGYVLARPALVGTVVGFEPRSLALEDDIERKIVALFAN